MQGQYWDAGEAVDRGHLQHGPGLWVEQDSDRGPGPEEDQQRLRDILPGKKARPGPLILHTDLSVRD